MTSAVVTPSAPAVVSPDAVAALRTAVLILSRRMRYQPLADELSASEAAVLGRIGREGPQTPGALARAEHVQPPSMTRILERLEGRGLLRRDPRPGDRRQVLISRTPAAEDLVARTREVRTRWLTDLLSTLSPDDIDTVERAAPILAALAECPDTAAPPRPMDRC